MEYARHCPHRSQRQTGDTTLSTTLWFGVYVMISISSNGTTQTTVNQVCTKLHQQSMSKHMLFVLSNDAYIIDNISWQIPHDNNIRNSYKNSTYCETVCCHIISFCDLYLQSYCSATTKWISQYIWSNKQYFVAQQILYSRQCPW